jgi:hypothetical protein
MCINKQKYSWNQEWFFLFYVWSNIVWYFFIFIRKIIALAEDKARRAKAA